MRSLLVMGMPYQHVPEVSIVNTPHAGRLEGGSDRLGSRPLGLKPHLLHPLANIRLAEVSLGRTDTCLLLLEPTLRVLGWNER
jgi:hypothetical protein